MKPVMLLGGRGFIGSALAQRLRHQGVPVLLVARDNIGQLEQLLPECGTVVHLASGTTPGSSARKPELEHDNIALTQRLVDALKTNPSIHLIYFSSGGTVYGNPGILPVPEDAPLAPLSNYGLAKVAQEAMCLGLRSKGHAVTILRPSNVYGPGQTLKGGFGLVPTLLEHASSGTTLEIWGDGENVRDFIYIDDLVDATVRIMVQPHKAGTYNLGSGVGHSVNAVKRQVELITGRHLDTHYQPARGVDVRAVVLHGQWVASSLGWFPHVALADGIARTWQALSHR